MIRQDYANHRTATLTDLQALLLIACLLIAILI